MAMDLFALTEAIQEDIGLNRPMVERVIKSMIDVVTKTVTKGDVVHIRRFGKFRSKKRAGRMFRHPKTGFWMRSAATTVPEFAPAPTFKTAVAAKKTAAVPAPAVPKQGIPKPAVPKKA